MSNGDDGFVLWMTPSLLPKNAGMTPAGSKLLTRMERRMSILMLTGVLISVVAKQATLRVYILGCCQTSASDHVLQAIRLQVEK